MLVNFLWWIRVSGVKMHILTNFHYSSNNIGWNKLFGLFDHPIGIEMTWTTHDQYGVFSYPMQQ